MNITKKELILYSSNFNKNPKNHLARNALTKSKLNNIIINSDESQKQNRIFSNKIKIETTASDQHSSGRCWLFALCNMMRLPMIAKYQLKTFEFSAAYLSFFDKLERSNYFLSVIIKYRKEPENSRINDIFLKDPISDGGNWNMILNLVNKYGLIPRNCFNESEHSKNTRDIDSFLNNKLRDYAFLIRNLSDTEFKNIDVYMKKFMNEIYRILVIFMGEPPTKFDWEYTTKGKYNILKSISPQDFYKKHIPINLDNYILLADNPILKYGIRFTVNNFNNMVNGQEISYINVGNEILKSSVKKSIDKGDAVWFGCDVDKYLNKSLSVLDTNMINYKLVFDTDISLNKKNRLLYQTSDVTHAMLIRGYDNQTKQKPVCDQSKSKSKPSNSKSKPSKSKSKLSKSKSSLKSRKRKTIKKQSGGWRKKKSKKKKCLKYNKQTISNNPITKYLVENSWGKTIVGDENIVMTTDFFDEYVYIVAINIKYVPKNIINIEKQKAHRLDIWDPFGYLLF